MRTAAKPLVLLLTLLICPPAEARLPEDVVPRRYQIEIAPDLGAGTFGGSEVIEVEVKRTATSITLHAVDLKITEAQVAAGASDFAPARVTVDEKNETITLTPARPLAPGPARLRLTFSGRLSDKLRGLYLARGGEHRFALTQFESTDARRAFPCFDEPALKAPFKMSLVVESGHAAISNGAVVKRAPAGPGPYAGKERVEFAETLPISSYLVAIATGPFVSRTVEIDRPAGKLPITVWCAPGREQHTAFALAEAARMVPFMDAWFDFPYPYGKLDLIAAPEFMYGGMENVAAIVFREARLILDEKTASHGARVAVSEVIAHEIAHQWFGDVVTMEWWDDIWLNESFATWMEKKTSDALHPTWRMARDFAAERDGSLAVDELPSTHPIHPHDATAERPAPTSPTIIYGKGSQVLRMIEGWLGEDRFRDGIRHYVKKFQHKNARAEDLWAALAETSGRPVQAFGEKWVGQAGHPLVTVEARCEGGHTKLRAQQARLVTGGAAPDATWPVALCVKFPAGEKDGSVTSRCFELPGKDGEFELPGPCARWVYGNAGAAGFYRVQHDDKNLAAIASDLARLLPHERAAILDDEWALAGAGKVSFDRWLDLARRLGGDRDPAVLQIIGNGIATFDSAHTDDKLRPALAARVRALFGKSLAPLGFAVRPKDDDDTRRARVLLLSTLGLHGADPKVLAWASKTAAAVAEGKPGIDGTLAEIALAISARAGDAKRWESLLARMKSAPTPELHDRLFAALTRFDDPGLAARTLALSLDGTLRTEELDVPARRLLEGRPPARDVAWKFVQDNIAALQQRASPYGAIRLIGGVGSLCSHKDAAAARALFDAHPLPDDRLAVALAVERITSCADRHERARGMLATWLKSK